MNELTVPQQIERRDFQRLMTYRENLDFYNGVQWLGNPRRGERRITFNYVQLCQGFRGESDILFDERAQLCC
jgi:hypothetical protein